MILHVRTLASTRESSSTSAEAGLKLRPSKSSSRKDQSSGSDCIVVINCSKLGRKEGSSFGGCRRTGKDAIRLCANGFAADELCGKKLFLSISQRFGNMLSRSTKVTPVSPRSVASAFSSLYELRLRSKSCNNIPYPIPMRRILENLAILAHKVHNSQPMTCMPAWKLCSKPSSHCCPRVVESCGGLKTYLET